jgi:hypothetical protein
MKKNVDRRCGMEIMTPPVELNVAFGRFIITLKGRKLSWDSDYLTAKDIEELKSFIGYAYEQGFTDGSQIALNKK